MELGAAFRRQRLLAGKAASHVDDVHRFAGAVADRPAAVGRRQVDAVGHRTAPVESLLETCLDPGQPLLDPQETADVARVAVGVPAAGVDDLERLGEVALAVEQRQDDQAVVGDHVAVAAVLVVAVALGEPFPVGAPVAVPGVPAAQVGDHSGDDGPGRNVAERAVEQPVRVPLDERHRLHRGQHPCAVDRLAVVAHPRGGGGQADGEVGIAGSDHRPAVDEDLRADLLGHHLAVQLHRSASGRLDAALETKVSRVLGGVAEAAPPEHRPLPDQVVEPALADLPRAEIGA